MSNRLYLVIAVAVIGLSSSTVAKAQNTRVVETGDRVRIYQRGSDEPRETRLMRVSGDSLWFQDCANCVLLSVTRGAVSRVFVARRASAEPGHIAIGAVIGVAIGAAAWFAKVVSDSRNCHDGPCGIGIIFTPVAALVGGVFGGVIAAIPGRTEWVLAELPPIDA